MKSSIVVLGLVLFMVNCSHQMDVTESGKRYVTVDRTRYGVTGPDLWVAGIRCASVDGNTVTFWPQEGGCDPREKHLDDLSAEESDLIRVKPSKQLYGRKADNIIRGNPEIGTETVRFADYISVVAIKAGDQFRMKPIECLNEEEKELVRWL